MAEHYVTLVIKPPKTVEPVFFNDLFSNDSATGLIQAAAAISPESGSDLAENLLKRVCEQREAIFTSGFNHLEIASSFMPRGYSAPRNDQFR